MNGIMLIDKPQDWTSHDVVAKLRGKLKLKRIGHGGTLDPMATGLLPVFLGRATRAIQFMPGDKTYDAVMRLGVTTSTQDITGAVLSTCGKRPDPTETALSFIGERLQTPPMVSAVKVNGQKLYDLARRGIEVERAARPVTFYAIDISKIDEDDYALRVKCSGGTYIRTLAHDIGQALGCGASLAALRRVAVGDFTVDDAVGIDGAAEERLLPIETLFTRHPVHTLGADGERLVRNGNPCAADTADGLYRVYSPGGEFIALGSAERGVLSTVKSFFEVAS
ncbi:tRNA pseudouridine synthase B [Clostridia bacterium]|nr:tRNA pseudouridine synthase B [Clostridia bacterium]